MLSSPLEPDLEKIVSSIDANANQTYDFLLDLHDAPSPQAIQKTMEYFEVSAALAIAVCRQYGITIRVDGKKPDSYWNYAVNIKSEILEVTGGKKVMPSRNDMFLKKKSTLSTVIGKRFGTYKKCAKEFGLTFVNTNEGAYREWSQIENVVNEIFEKHPELEHKFPGAWWLRNNGYSNLVSAIVAVHGGMSAARKKLGAKPVVEQQPIDTSLESIKKSLEHIWALHPQTKNTVPPENWFRKHGYFRLNHTITMYGGCPKLRETLGYEQVHKHEISEYDTDEKMSAAVTQFLADHPEFKGNLPSGSWLNKNGYSVMAKAIYTIHGGMVNVRKKAGLRLIRDGASLYPDAAASKAALDAIITQHTELNNQPPTTKWMIANGYHALWQCIEKQFEGGFRALYSQYNPKTKLRKANGFWGNYENVKAEARAYIAKYGHLPSIEVLRKSYSSLAAAICVSGGVMKVRDDLQREGISTSDGLSAVLLEYVGERK